jgi:hypothetical protein
MKHIIKTAVFGILLFLFSCNKETIVDTPTQVGISTVTHYVVLTLKGPAVESIVVGETYVDSGVVATENGQPAKYTTSGSVDVNTVGIYTITYTAVNQDGYPSSVSRTVAVIPSTPVPGVDLSGTYSNIGTLILTADISNLAPGVYYTTNCWGGASTAVIPAYFFSSDGLNITIPPQNGAAGNMDGSGTYSGGLITWTITLYDQGPITRTKSWQKQ